MTCTYPECGSMKIENMEKALCATHNKLLRKPVKEVKKPKPINKFSKNMKIELTEYTHLRRQFLKEHPACAVYPHMRSTTIHHQRGRIGDLLCDTRFWLAVSMEAHILIESEPIWAKEMGYSLKRNGQ